MISFTVRMKFDDKDRATIEDILRKLTAASRLEPGCVTYIAHFVEGEPATVLIYEQYKNEAALEAHRNSTHFKEYATGGLYQLMKDRSREGLHAVE
ncbi:MAG TPA: putative quinol monooxygenase [Acidobacteriaceae bacterium]|nr:putative quinol monooxygenase [Acidobacteriaceae bacterium]